MSTNIDASSLEEHVNAQAARSRPEWSVRLAIVFLILVAVAAALAPWISPHDPLATDASDRLANPSLAHLLGTDPSGRDVLSRTIYGAHSAFLGTGIAVLTMLVIGVPWGLLGGLGGSAADQALMRLADAFLAVPGLVLAVAITAVLGPGLTTSMIAVGIVFAPSVAILLRASLVPLRRAEYVLVARSLGSGRVSTAFRHSLPNAFAPVLVQVCSLASICLIIQASLGFLGLGEQPPNPGWGTDLAQAYTFFTVAPVATLVPGLVTTLCAFSLSRLGDGVRSVLDVG